MAMTVEQLIKELQKRPPNEIVIIAEPTNGDTYEIESVDYCGSVDGIKTIIDGGEWSGNVG